LWLGGFVVGFAAFLAFWYNEQNFWSNHAKQVKKLQQQQQFQSTISNVENQNEISLEKTPQATSMSTNDTSTSVSSTRTAESNSNNDGNEALSSDSETPALPVVAANETAPTEPAHVVIDIKTKQATSVSNDEEAAAAHVASAVSVDTSVADAVAAEAVAETVAPHAPVAAAAATTTTTTTTTTAATETDVSKRDAAVPVDDTALVADIDALHARVLALSSATRDMVDQAAATGSSLVELNTRNDALTSLLQHTLELSQSLAHQQSFEHALQGVQTAAKQLDAGLLSAAAQRVPLDDARRGVASPAVLRQLLNATLDAAQHVNATTAASNAPLTQAAPSWWRDAYASLVRRVTVWPRGVPAGDSPAAVAARAEWYFEHDEVTRAIAELTPLAQSDDERLRQCASAFTDSALRRVRVNQLFEVARRESVRISEHFKNARQ